MEIRTLENISIETIVNTLVVSFQGYFVPIPDDVSYWKNRLKNAQYSPECSWGVFDNDKLVAFVLNCVATKNTKLTLYNTGTGVLPNYRGNALVDKMYQFGLSYVKQKNITTYLLEVIQENTKAIKVYERIGFNITRKLYCFQGELFTSNKITTNNTIALTKLKNDGFYAWDFSTEIIKLNTENQAFEVVDNLQNVIGYFVINPKSGIILQLEAFNDNWELLFNGISQLITKFRIVNIDSRRTELISFLTEKLSAKNTVNQFEMGMNLI